MSKIFNSDQHRNGERDGDKAAHSTWEFQVAPDVPKVQLEKTPINLLYYCFLVYLHPSKNQIQTWIQTFIPCWKAVPSLSSAQFSPHGTHCVSNPTRQHLLKPSSSQKYISYSRQTGDFGKHRSCPLLCSQDCELSLEEDIEITEYASNAVSVLKSKIPLLSSLPKGAQPLSSPLTGTNLQSPGREMCARNTKLIHGFICAPNIIWRWEFLYFTQEPWAAGDFYCISIKWNRMRLKKEKCDSTSSPSAQHTLPNKWE